ncbi:efflux RND transporter periplasmic adaptor subunit [Pinibacter aurantiacus]|uniref:Efflux RND transporter periplasmic adaptor subunit n=1 Tax=Pinibacter aurantiacus TaxID=2851599 RepID=A0A9E2W2Z6_9BACT|nr:efflux RND transporter periplasmic adaptor subunit [Pinibacter aurantiacus]MBV4357930.1 efflux RND transporter periplasmic adaptor subunit [Pinibacter aurantiacus]
MNKKLLWIIISVVLLVVLLVVLQKAGAFGKDEGVKVTAEKAAKRTIIETVNASGKVYPEIEVKISPDISGEIIELTVAEGDSVSKGEVLAKIYPDIYVTQRDQAAAVVNQQRATVNNSQEQLNGLKASMDQTQKAYDRQKQLLNEKVISQSEFEQAESAYLSAKANYSAAVQGIKSNQAATISAQANLDKAAKDLSRTTILSPMSGIVSLMSVKKGERVVGSSMMAGTEMMRIADMSKIEVRVDVSENDIPKVKLGDSALVEVDAYNNRKFKGIVTQIASSNTTAATASSSTSTSNDVTNYKVYIRLLPASYNDIVGKGGSSPFRPGMSASADIQTKRNENVLSVPINAVTTREKGSDNAIDKSKNSVDANNNNNNNNTRNAVGSPEEEKKSNADDLEEVVYILQADKTVKKAVVKTDIQDVNYIQIVSGIKDGDEVISGPYSLISKTLKDGTKVQVVDKDKLFDQKKK